MLYYVYINVVRSKGFTYLSRPGWPSGWPSRWLTRIYNKSSFQTFERVFGMRAGVSQRIAPSGLVIDTRSINYADSTNAVRVSTTIPAADFTTNMW